MRLIDMDAQQYEIGIENDCVSESPLAMLKYISGKICSCCGKWFSQRLYDYCPYCGPKLDEVTE